MAKKKINNNFDLEFAELFSAIEDGSLAEPEPTKELEPRAPGGNGHGFVVEEQLLSRSLKNHSDVNDFNKVVYWEKHLAPKMDEIVQACNDIGIPMQACAILGHSEQGYNLRHYRTVAITNETLAAYHFYKLPHGVSHLFLFLSRIPMFVMSETQYEGTAYNHNAQFEDEIVPLVSQLNTSCQMVDIPLQMGFIPMQNDEETKAKGVVTELPMPCEMTAAFACYQAPLLVLNEVLAIAAELNKGD